MCNATKPPQDVAKSQNKVNEMPKIQKIDSAIDFKLHVAIDFGTDGVGVFAPFFCG